MKRFVYLLVAVALLGGVVVADEDKEEYEDKRYKDRYKKEFKEKKYQEYKKAMTLKEGLQPLYKKECGSCHMAYQLEFLPKRSWQKMMEMKSLEDHFGVDATLDEEDRKKILAFLEANAGDSKRVYGEFREFIESIKPNSTPLRISQTPYFKKEHRKIDKKWIKQKEVKTIANCTACHRKAESGNYEEDSLIIPNYGRWDD